MKLHKKNPDINFIHSSFEGFNPKGEQFDVVCTGGLLTHMNPKAVPSIIDKMVMLSKSHIFGFDNYADKLTEVNYRGNLNQLFKQNYPKLFRDRYPSLETKMEIKYPYINEDLTDIVYLLKKPE